MKYRNKPRPDWVFERGLPLANAVNRKLGRIAVVGRLVIRQRIALVRAETLLLTVYSFGL